MARTPRSLVVYLDTHVVMWLHDGLVDRLSTKAVDAIESGRLYISPMVELELQYLHEIGRVRFTARSVIGPLQRDIGLRIGEASFPDIVRQACALDWTRDPFDRLIVAECMVANGWLLTRDETILSNSSCGMW